MDSYLDAEDTPPTKVLASFGFALERRAWAYERLFLGDLLGGIFLRGEGLEMFFLGGWGDVMENVVLIVISVS